MQSLIRAVEEDVCCGGPPPPKSAPDSLPGYTLNDYVKRFSSLAGLRIPIVTTAPSFSDTWGSILTRIGIARESYIVSPGLYGIGEPDRKSPVIVTANYKLSFDTVRFAMADHDLWLLVLDTRGINVWCAAGKNTFSTDELVTRIENANLGELVEHRTIIVPQLGASGVAAHTVKRRTGFSVVYGPVRVGDLSAFLKNDNQAEPAMRMATFSFTERAVLIPVELYLLKGVLWWLLPLLFLISGFTTDFFSIQAALSRGLFLLASTIIGIISGAILVPLVLPYLPGRSFSLKGAISGIVTGGLFIYSLQSIVTIPEKFAIVLWIISVSSYLGMNFTGSTPFTSASGVEWEMKRALPLQVGATTVALVLWVFAPLL